MVKIICSDVDGTLLNKQREVDAETVRAFNRLDPDIALVLASSRMPKAMWHIQQKLNAQTQPLICYNGALILASGGDFRADLILSSSLIDALIAGKVIEKALALQLHISIYQNNTWLVSAMDFYAQREISNTKTEADGLFTNFTTDELEDFIGTGLHKMMIMGDPETLDELVLQFGTEPAFSMWRSKDIYLEITPATNKLLGLNKLLQLYKPFANLTLANVMSFGDGYNDFDLIKEARYGIAMENGVADLKKIAYATTKTNKEHGVAVFLNDFFAK